MAELVTLYMYSVRPMSGNKSLLLIHWYIIIIMIANKFYGQEPN